MQKCSKFQKGQNLKQEILEHLRLAWTSSLPLLSIFTAACDTAAALVQAAWAIQSVSRAAWKLHGAADSFCRLLLTTRLTATAASIQHTAVEPAAMATCGLHWSRTACCSSYQRMRLRAARS